MTKTAPTDRDSVPTGHRPIDRLLEIMVKLRDPKSGCPWDKEQSFASIAPYTIEEAYEVADAIETGDLNALLGELGDLLFQVVFYAQMAREAGAFDFDDVADGASEKMLARHPHVFGNEIVSSATAQNHAWEEHKAAERDRRAQSEGRPVSALDGVARALPALIRAAKLQRRAAGVGFDWPETVPVAEKIEEELAELKVEMDRNGTKERLEEEMGDLLFACVNLARHLDLDSESALRRANEKFDARFRTIERQLARRGSSPKESTIEEMDRIWTRTKLDESKKKKS